MKSFLNKLIKDRKNKIILFVYLSFVICVLLSNISEFWLIVITIFLIISGFLEFKFKILFFKSFLIQLGIIFVIITSLIIYASFRDISNKDDSLHSVEEITNSPFYKLCLPMVIEKENNFLISLGYTEKNDGSWVNKDGDYPREDFNESNEEALMTDILFNCIENKGLTINNFDDVKRYQNLVSIGDYDCSDFDTWEDSQKVFIRDDGIKNDPYNLDKDRNGVACESLVK